MHVPTDPKVFSSSNTLPVPSQYLVLVGLNSSGTFGSLWRAEDIQRRVLLGLGSTGIAVGGVIATDESNNQTFYLNGTDGTLTLADGVVTAYRGDPSTFDFTKTDLTLDADWHDLDLSSIIPAGNHRVWFRTYYVHTNPGASKMVLMRKNGATNNVNADWHIQWQATERGLAFVRLDDDRIMEYRIDGAAGEWTAIGWTIADYDK